MECIARDQRFRRGSQRPRRRSCEIAGREGESLKRSDGRLVSRHLPFIAKQPCIEGDLTQVLRRPVELATQSGHSRASDQCPLRGKAEIRLAHGNGC